MDPLPDSIFNSPLKIDSQQTKIEIPTTSTRICKLPGTLPTTVSRATLKTHISCFFLLRFRRWWLMLIRVKKNKCTCLGFCSFRFSADSIQCFIFHIATICVLDSWCYSLNDAKYQIPDSSDPCSSCYKVIVKNCSYVIRQDAVLPLLVTKIYQVKNINKIYFMRTKLIWSAVCLIEEVFAEDIVTSLRMCLNFPRISMLKILKLKPFDFHESSQNFFPAAKK